MILRSLGCSSTAAPVMLEWSDAAAGVLLAALFASLCFIAFHVLHRRFQRLRWKWSQVACHSDPEGVAVRDGVTWRVQLLVRYPAAWGRADRWFITRADRKVCCIEEPDRIATFPTREIAAAAAQWCADHPCACVVLGIVTPDGYERRCCVCGGSRASGSPPGILTDSD